MLVCVVVILIYFICKFFMKNFIFNLYIEALDIGY